MGEQGVRFPLRRIRSPRWAEQPGTWRQARPELIAAALRRAQARPSGNWFVLAGSREISASRPFGRTVAGVELVAYMCALFTVRVGVDVAGGDAGGGELLLQLFGVSPVYAEA